MILTFVLIKSAPFPSTSHPSQCSAELGFHTSCVEERNIACDCNPHSKYVEIGKANLQSINVFHKIYKQELLPVSSMHILHVDDSGLGASVQKYSVLCQVLMVQSSGGIQDAWH